MYPLTIIASAKNFSCQIIYTIGILCNGPTSIALRTLWNDPYGVVLLLSPSPPISLCVYACVLTSWSFIYSLYLRITATSCYATNGLCLWNGWNGINRMCFGEFECATAFFAPVIDLYTSVSDVCIHTQYTVINDTLSPYKYVCVYTAVEASERDEREKGILLLLFAPFLSLLAFLFSTLIIIALYWEMREVGHISVECLFCVWKIMTQIEWDHSLWGKKQVCVCVYVSFFSSRATLYGATT